MGKIRKIASSRVEELQCPYIREFVKKSTSIPLHELPAHLSSFPSGWPFNRGDLYHWIPLLNRFDDILETFSFEYQLHLGPQISAFGLRLLQGKCGDLKPGNAPEEVLTAAGFGRDGDRQLVEDVLAFTKILYENCANRALYASNYHLESLLNTTSTSLLVATLQLTLSLAQRFMAIRYRGSQSTHHSLLLANFNISLDKLQRIAMPFLKDPPGGKDSGQTTAQTGKRKSTSPNNLVAILEGNDLPADMAQRLGTVHLSYYTQQPQKQNAGPRLLQDLPSQQNAPRRASALGPNRAAKQDRSQDSDVRDGLSHDDEASSESRQQRTLELFGDDLDSEVESLLAKHLPQLPRSYHFEFLQKLRTAIAMNTSKRERENIVAARLLAIANLSCVYHDSMFQLNISQLDSEEPKHLQLPYQLAELVHPHGDEDSAIPLRIQSLALCTLETLARQKSKQSDVIAALNINVNHGVLFYLLRKAAADLAVEESTSATCPQDWLDSLCSLLTTMASHTQTRNGDSMIAAGLMGVLVQMLNLRTARAERYQQKIIGFLHEIIYTLRDGFQSLVDFGGLEAVSTLTAYQVQTALANVEKGNGLSEDYKTPNTDFQTPFRQQQTLRWIFKFLNQMLSHGQGNFDRVLRNLIDTPSLLAALRVTIANGPIFGSNVWKNAAHILSNFINNEPPSYPIIAEAGVSRAFLDAITLQQMPAVDLINDNVSLETLETLMQTEQFGIGILPSNDAISVIPSVVSAICLHDTGKTLIQDSPVIRRFFQIFLSPKHVKALDEDTEYALMLGTAFDEMGRHHPDLKKEISTAVNNTMEVLRNVLAHRAKTQSIGAKLWVEGPDGKACVAGGQSALLGRTALQKSLSAAIYGDAQDSKDVEMLDSSDGESDSIVRAEAIDTPHTKSNELELARHLRVMFRFLGAYLANGIVRDFFDAGSLETLLDFTVLPSLPYNLCDLMAPSPNDELGRLLHQLIGTRPHLVTPAIFNRLRSALHELEPLMEHDQPWTFFDVFTESPASTDPDKQRILQHGTTYAKALVIVHILTNSLGMTLNQSYSHRGFHSFFSSVNFADVYAEIITKLGKLQRSCIWESLLIQRSVPLEWERETRMPTSDLLNLNENELFPTRPMSGTTPLEAATPNGQLQTDPETFGDTGRGPASASLGTDAHGGDQAATSGSDVPGAANFADGQNGSMLTSPDSLTLGKEQPRSAQFKNFKIIRYLLSEIPHAITSCMQGIGRNIVSKRVTDIFTRQNGYQVADAMGQALVDHLKFDPRCDEATFFDRDAYRISVSFSLMHLLMDQTTERVIPQNQALTLVLWSFRNKGGLARIVDFLDHLVHELIHSDDDSRTDANLHGVNTIMTFFSQLAGHNIVDQSVQSAAIVRSHNADTRSLEPSERLETFSKAQFLVDARMFPMKSVLTMWESGMMEKAPSSTVKTVIPFMQKVLESEFENGACKTTAHKPSARKDWKPKIFQVRQDKVTELTSAGFSESIALESLFRCFGDDQMAREYCEVYSRSPNATRNPIPPNAARLPKRSSTTSASAALEPATPSGSGVSLASNRTGTAPVSSSNTGDEVQPQVIWPPDVLPLIPDPVDGPVGTEAGNVSTDDTMEEHVDADEDVAREDPFRTTDVFSIAELDSMRKVMRSDIIDRSLDVLRAHEDITFELSDLIATAARKAPDPSAMKTEVASTLVQTLVSFQTDDDLSPNGKQIAVYSHLLGILLQDRDFFSIAKDEVVEHFGMLVNFIRVSEDANDPSSWVPNILLVLERLLAEDAQPQLIQWNFSAEKIPEEIPLATPAIVLIAEDAKIGLARSLIEIMPRVRKDERLASAITRVLAILTRNKTVASLVGEKKNIQRLFLMAKQLCGVTDNKLQGAFLGVLRHIVEDAATIRNIMRSEIQTAFTDESQSRSSPRTMDIAAYIRHFQTLILRDHETFVDVTNSLLEVHQPTLNTVRPPALVLKTANKAAEAPLQLQDEQNSGQDDAASNKAATSDSAKTSTDAKSPVEKTKSAEIKIPIVENPDGVVHFILSELSAYKDVDDKYEDPSSEAASGKNPDDGDVHMSGAETPEPVSSTQSLSSADKKRAERLAFKSEQHPVYIYRCFLLQCLSELLQSYNRVKVELVNFSRRTDSQTGTPSKSRSWILNHILSTLLPSGTIEHLEDEAHRKKSNTSYWAINVVVSLCMKTNEIRSTKSEGSVDAEDTELTYVRKFVLEHCMRAFKEALSLTDPLEMKYSCILTLSDLLNRMLMARPVTPTIYHGPPYNLTSHKQLAQLMYEKNFISVLTSALTDIDLNFPNVKRVVKYILRPLHLLTMTAVQIGSSPDRPFNPDNDEEEDVSVASSGSDLAGDREETPDLYRNSTLAMFDPATRNETESISSDDADEDEEMYDDEYGNEMEFEEEEQSDDDDALSDDVDGDGNAVGLPPNTAEFEYIVPSNDPVFQHSEDDDTDDDEDMDEDDEDDDMDDDIEHEFDSEDIDEEDIEIDDDLEIHDFTDAPTHGERRTSIQRPTGLQESDSGDWAADHRGAHDEDEDIDLDGAFEMDAVGNTTANQLDHLVHVLDDDASSGLMDHNHSLLDRIAEGQLNVELPYMEDVEDEDEEEDEFDEEVVYEPRYDDDDGEQDDDWEAEMMNPTVANHGHHHHHHHHHHMPPHHLRGPPWPVFPTGRESGFGGPQRANDDGVNPLLQRHTPRRHNDFNEPIRELMGLNHARRGLFSREGPVSVISNLLNVMSQSVQVLPHGPNGGGFHLHVGGGGRSGMMPRMGGPLDPGPFGHIFPELAEPPRRGPRDDATQVINFTIGSTQTRWNEISKIMYGGSCPETAQRVHNSIVRLLLPPAIKAQKKRKAEEEVDRKKKQAEEEARKAKEEAEKLEREAAEKKEKEAREAAEKEAAEREAAAAREMEEAQAMTSTENTSADQASSTAPSQMEGVETSQPADGGENAEAQSSEPVERSFITIRGSEIEITGLGIDQEYLLALPEDIRAEVLTNALAERRSQAVTTGHTSSEYQAEFLNALPEDMREELLEQEAADRRRQEREENRRRQVAEGGNAGGPSRGPEDMDTASFLASLDPSLRQVVLMDQNEEMLAQLPQEYRAEAQALGSDRRLRHFDAPRLSRGSRMPAHEPQREGFFKRPKNRPVLPILEKSGIAALLRLVFMPIQGSAKGVLHDVLHDACENRQNRAEVISMLLGILQDCSADHSSVEKSFMHLSLRAKQSSSQKLPSSKRQSSQGLMQSHSEASAVLVVQQCLSVLSSLTQYNNAYIASFFLTEHETGTGFKSKTQRKGKGKERETRASKVPINALLSLLDRKLIVDSSSIMEQLASLLHKLTSSLPNMLKAKSKAADEKGEDAKEATEQGASADTNLEPARPIEGEASATDSLTGGSARESVSVEGSAATQGEIHVGEAENASSSKPESKTTEDKTKILNPPDIPTANLSLVVNIMTCQECSSKAFRDTVTLIANLSPLPGAREVFGKELVRQAQDLAVAILQDLTELSAQISTDTNGTDVQGMALAKFSPGSSHQAKLLRVLTALDYIFDPSRGLDSSSTSSDKTKETDDELAAQRKHDMLASLYESAAFAPLWTKLSDCLTAIRDREDMFYIATILLPAVESLMVVCKNVSLQDSPVPYAQPSQMDFAMTSPLPDARMENVFFRFTEDHRKILNNLVRHNTKLMSGSFSLLVKNSKVLEFDNKRNYFTRKLHTRTTERHTHPHLQLQVRRDEVFLDSFKALHFKSGEEIKYGKLSVRFNGEEGIDAGGVTREWFQALSRQMFNPDYALFVPVASDRTTFHPNRLSSINPEHLMFFKFIGRIIGKALYEGRVLDCHFSRAVYKRILGMSVSVKDMENLDLEYYKSMDWILQNDITDIITETFSVETDVFGEKQIIDLIENGRNVAVTEDNKHEFVRLVVESKLTGSVQEQLEKFLEGFHDIVPREIVRIFNEQELELLISGLPDIDVDDWKGNSEYHNYTAASPQIQWFWRAVRSFNPEERAKLLQFITGTSKVPLNGFKELEGMNGHNKFSIHRDYGNKTRLPSSHTCFNQLDLPEYDDYETLRERLYTAITAGNQYFGFA